MEHIEELQAIHNIAEKNLYNPEKIKYGCSKCNNFPFMGKRCFVSRSFSCGEWIPGKNTNDDKCLRCTQLIIDEHRYFTCNKYFDCKLNGNKDFEKKEFTMFYYDIHKMLKALLKNDCHAHFKFTLSSYERNVLSKITNYSCLLELENGQTGNCHEEYKESKKAIIEYFSDENTFNIQTGTVKQCILTKQE